jgi:uncharacterized protein YggE
MRLTPVLATLFVASVAGAQAPVASPPAPMINATGTGEVQIVPDRATLQLAVETRSSTAAAAGQENARLQQRVIDAVRKLGIPGADISTSGYTVYPEQSYEGNKPKVIGYVARNTVRVELRRIDQVGSVIDAALSAGANVVSSLRFSSSHFDEARRTALGLAVEQARADAEAMARAAGGTLGTLSEVSSSYSPEPIPRFDTQMMRASAGAPAPTPIEPGQQTVQVTVSTRWIFVPGR